MADDSFTEVTSQSWFDRLGGAIKGVLAGLVMFIVAFPLLWWNEGRAVRTAKGLEEAGGSVHAISADKIDPAMDKLLVHATSEATTTETLSDPQFLISLPAIKLKRSVQMYQWIEKESTETTKKLGGGEEKKTTTSYEKGWSDQLIDSQKFKKSEEHVNPTSMKYSSEQHQAKAVTFGAFKLPSGLIGQISNFEPITLTKAEREKLPPDLQNQVRVVKNEFYAPADPKKLDSDSTTPSVGDLRIAFAAVKPETVSIMARQLGDTFEGWQSSNGTSIDRLMLGSVSSENMIGKMVSENTMLTWILRAAGFLLMAFGISMVFSPLVVLADVLPFLGNLLQMGIGLFAAVFAAFFALTTIAIAWIAFRPVLGISLLVVAVGLVVGFRMLRGKRAPPATAGA